MSIEQILQDFNIQDKPDFFATTSYKFKTDLWNFFYKPKFKATNVVELGTSRGYTTTVLSYLFSNVYTINKKQTQHSLHSEKHQMLYAQNHYALGNFAQAFNFMELIIEDLKKMKKDELNKATNYQQLVIRNKFFESKYEKELYIE